MSKVMFSSSIIFVLNPKLVYVKIIDIFFFLGGGGGGGLLVIIITFGRIRLNSYMKQADWRKIHIQNQTSVRYLVFLLGFKAKRGNKIITWLSPNCSHHLN